MSENKNQNYKVGYDTFETYAEAELEAKKTAARGYDAYIWQKVATVAPFVANVEVTKVTV